MNHEKTIRILSGIDSALVEECAVCRGSLPPERNGMRKAHSSRRLAVLVAAACLLLALAVTAYATGAIQSLIQKYWGSISYEIPDDQLREKRPDYAQWLDEQLETQNMMLGIGEQAVQTEADYGIPGLEGAGVTLLEYYYDGEKIALGCQFHAPGKPVDFSFYPEAYPNLPFQAVEKNGYPSYVSLVKDPADVQRIEDGLQKDGSISFLVLDAWLSDHVYANGADLGCCHTDPDANGFFLVDPMVAGIGEIALPESCRNLPEIEVSLTYRVSTYAFQLEGDTVQYVRVGQTDYPIRFTIPNLNPDGISPRWSLTESDMAGGSLHISQQVQGTSVTIDASIPELPTQQLHTVTLEADAGLWNAIGRELTLDRFPQIQTDLDGGSRNICLTDEATGNLLLSLECSAEGIPGMLQYLDVQRDLNGSTLDGWEKVFVPHYMTSIIPDGMDFTPEQAVQEVISLLESNSCFQFSPWNIQAEFDQQKQQGCYRITLRPEYQGMPIYGQRTTTQAFLSGDGLFCCQGMLLLRECREEAVEAAASWQQAVEAVVNNIPQLSSFDLVQCGKIRLGYLAEVQEEQVVLSPAWVFECSQSQGESIDYYEIAVLAESGRIWTTSNWEGIWLNPA